MKNVTILALFQALSSVVSSVLISKMSFIGRIGISTMYREYLIFKTWWKTALVLFAVQLLLILTLQIVKKINLKIQKILAITLIIIGITGTYFTYIDFTTTSHRMMKFSFHSGFYLFWLSWFITCFYFLLQRKPKQITDPSIEKTENLSENQLIK